MQASRARPAWLVPIALAGAIAAAVTYLSFRDGGYEPGVYLEAGAVAWLALGAIGLARPGLLGVVAAPRARLAAGLLAGFALLSALAMIWSDSPERSLLEAGRVAGLLAALLLGMVVARVAGGRADNPRSRGRDGRRRRRRARIEGPLRLVPGQRGGRLSAVVQKPAQLPADLLERAGGVAGDRPAAAHPPRRQPPQRRRCGTRLGVTAAGGAGAVPDALEGRDPGGALRARASPSPSPPSAGALASPRSPCSS